MDRNDELFKVVQQHPSMAVAHGCAKFSTVTPQSCFRQGKCETSAYQPDANMARKYASESRWHTALPWHCPPASVVLMHEWDCHCTGTNVPRCRSA
jgi:hypothetical protein